MPTGRYNKMRSCWLGLAPRQPRISILSRLRRAQIQFVPFKCEFWKSDFYDCSDCSHFNSGGCTL